jgi:hypothetical protein
MVLLCVYIHTGQAENYAWPRLETNLRPFFKKIGQVHLPQSISPVRICTLINDGL